MILYIETDCFLIFMLIYSIIIHIHISSDISAKKSSRFLYSDSLNMTIVEMRVHMDCAGCESKIKKALQKLDGVDDIDIDMGMQKVTVMGWADQKKVLKTVRKTGRRAEFWPFPYNPEYHNFTHRYYNQQQQQQQQYNYESQPTTYTYNTYQPASSYNYYKHGYSSNDYGSYHQLENDNLSILDERTSAMFSDDNPNACSIM